MFHLHVEKSSIEGFRKYIPEIHEDERGSFHEWVNPQVLQDLKKPFDFVQANLVQSRSGVIRGLHFSKKPQTKIITCVSGAIRDVVLDIRSSSQTFGQFASFDIDSSAGETIVIEPGLAHGYEVLTEFALVVYLTNNKYEMDDDFSINPMGKTEASIWNTSFPVQSTRDKNSPSFDYLLNSGLLNSLNF